MKLIHEDKFQKIYFDEEKQLIKNVFIQGHGYMLEDDFKELFLIVKDLTIKSKAKYSLTDTRGMDFTITPDLQAFSTVQMQEMYAAGYLQKHVLIIPQTDIFAQISVEQSIEDLNEAVKQETILFDNEEDALKALGF